MQPVIYHNPKCATSRAALKLLRDRGLDPKVVDYLKTPPSAKELAELVTLLKIAPQTLLRRRETEFRTLGLDKQQLSDAALLRLMARHPRLIERPIVIVGRRAALGRPPEAILALLE